MTSQIATYLTALALIAMLAIPTGVAAHALNVARYPYILIDIGTLGGPQSAATMTPNHAVTNDGAVLGVADTNASDPYANEEPGVNDPTNIDRYVERAFVWRNGVMTDLGALGNSPRFATAIGPISPMNAQGDVVGVSVNGKIDPLLHIIQADAVLWTHGHTIDLGTFGGYESSAWGINDAGMVIGAAANRVKDHFSMNMWGTQTRAFVWQHGVMHDLGTLGGPDSFAFFVNNRGQVAGVSYTNATVNPVTGQPTTHPFLWQNGHMQDLGTLGGSVPTFGAMNDMNSTGEVVGQSNLAGDKTFHPDLWNGQKLLDLGTLGGSTGFAQSLNNAGDVVGQADLAWNQTHHAFLWRHGMMKDLGSLPGAPCSGAVSINIHDQVVGATAITCGQGDGPPFLWQRGVMHALPDLVAPTAFQITEADTINDAGEIAGVGLANGQRHIFLMVPAGLAARQKLTSHG